MEYENTVNTRKTKKSRIGLIIGLAVVLVALIVGVVFLLIPKTETVYVLKNYTLTSPQGVEEYKYRYDDKGNPTRAFHMLKYHQTEAEYDEHGNPTEITFYSMSDTERKYGTPEQYKYSYDDQGLIRSCKQYFNGNKIGTWNFTWDKHGNLIRVMLDDEPEIGSNIRIVRQDWEYDRQGRLVTEYVCVAIYTSPIEPAAEYGVYRCDYRYNKDGTLESYEYAAAEDFVDDFEDVDYEDLDYTNGIYYRYTYDDDGRILTSETNYRGEFTENEFEYDSQGNLDREGFEFDDHGNLIHTGGDSEYQHDLEYEAVEMAPEAAQRYRRWASLYEWDIKTYYYPIASFATQTEMFYYYLIPNPIW